VLGIARDTETVRTLDYTSTDNMLTVVRNGGKIATRIGESGCQIGDELYLYCTQKETHGRVTLQLVNAEYWRKHVLDPNLTGAVRRAATSGTSVQLPEMLRHLDELQRVLSAPTRRADVDTILEATHNLFRKYRFGVANSSASPNMPITVKLH
jgi:hypothetical protein